MHSLADYPFAFCVCRPDDQDANVQTDEGKRFVIGFACLGMWLFGWAADSLTDIIDAAITSVGRRVQRRMRACTARVCGSQAKRRQQQQRRKTFCKQSYGLNACGYYYCSTAALLARTAPP